jgi:hypothetical protein
LEALRSLVDYRREVLAERTRLSNRLYADLEQLRPTTSVGDISRYVAKAQFAMSNTTAPLPASSGDGPTATGSTVAATGSSTGSCTTSP